MARIKKRDITKTEAWDDADWYYSEILAESMLPSFIIGAIGDRFSGHKRIDALKEILNMCPEYYPAMFDIGQNYMLDGRDSEAKRYFDRGFNIIKKHFTKKDLVDAYSKTCEFLIREFRYGMALDCYNELSEISTAKKGRKEVYGGMAECYVNLGNTDKAIESQQKIIKMHKSATNYSDLGWMWQVKGDLNKAEGAFKKALRINKNNDFAKNNLNACKLMKKEGMKNWNEYLLRKVNYDELEKLEDDERYEEEYDAMIADYNECRSWAFKSELLKNPEYDGYTLSEKHDICITLRYFLDFAVSLIYSDEWPLYENNLFIELSFKEIMHKFIFKTGDIDDKIFNDVYTALLEFYKFLQKNGLVSGSEYRDLEKKMLGLKPELREKMLRYNEVRHNPEYTEEEKEKIRDELFEGDHELLFL